MAPSCKIELARFSARLKIQDGAECGNSDLQNETCEMQFPVFLVESLPLADSTSQLYGYSCFFFKTKSSIKNPYLLLQSGTITCVYWPPIIQLTIVFAPVIEKLVKEIVTNCKFSLEKLKLLRRPHQSVFIRQDIKLNPCLLWGIP